MNITTGTFNKGIHNAGSDKTILYDL